jgi:anthranilate/para-aminobenzoate synthase component I
LRYATVVTPEEVTVGAGGAMAALSKPEKDVCEMQLNGEAVLQAIGVAARLRSRATG